MFLLDSGVMAAVKVTLPYSPVRLAVPFCVQRVAKIFEMVGTL